MACFRAGRALKRSGANRATGFMLLARWAIALPGWRFCCDFRGKLGDADYLVKRHLRPTPRILQGQALRDLASSAIDSTV